MKTSWLPLTLVMLTLMMLAPKMPADEGMWLFNNPPRKLLKEKYGFDPTPDWLKHVQLSSVRFNSGGSGSFISPHGLVMTNHHVGLETLQKLSKKGKDYVKDGFHARTHKEEAPAVDLELNVLIDIEDVTDRVKAAVKPGLPADKAFEARRAVIADIEKESLDKTGLRSNVVTLYQGGMYHLYRYKRYTDVRLVFAPEQQIAFFGGDPDNFAYPRYDFDICLFRVYEKGKPANIEHYLKWSKAGATKDELVFVSGNPGNTERIDTVADLKYLRDVGFPFLLERLYRLEVMLSVYSAYGQEHERKAKDLLFGVANSRKAREGGEAGLQDPALMALKETQEKAFKAAIAQQPELKGALAAFDTIAKVQKVRAANIREYQLLEGGAGFNSVLFGYARTLVRAAAEFPKPNDKRLEEYQDSDKQSLELKLFSSRPIYDDFEQYKLANSLSWLDQHFGGDSKGVQKVLSGKSPVERAAELVSGTKLKDVDFRKKLYEGGKAAIAASDDPMILLAREVDKRARQVRKIMENDVQEVKRQAYDQIAKAKFALEGTNTYPDATFTLRLSFGTVKGYEEAGEHIPFETTFAGLYQRAKEHDNVYPFDLPQRWLDRKDKLNLKVPFNFVCTDDIIGGNSGSPVINRKAEVVGLIFDGNIQSLVWDFVYTDTQGRSVAVHSRGIIEALRKVYDANDLADEMVGTGK
jgi:Peptidase S46